MWVSLVENNEHHSHGADFFVKKSIHNIFEKGPAIDVLLLACTHYPLLKEKIEEYLPLGVKLVSQGEADVRSGRSKPQETLFAEIEGSLRKAKNEQEIQG